MTSTLSTTNYPYKNWHDIFPDNNVKLEKLFIHSSWRGYVDEIIADNQQMWARINTTLSQHMQNGQQIYPYPGLIFAGLNATPFNKIKAVILGQDSYPNSDTQPNAMGISFSVPNGAPIPSSLQNIYKNAHQYGHLEGIPTNGNLTMWSRQGCLMINSALTVLEKKPNSHAVLWNWFTDKLIEKISAVCDEVVFLLWGGFAFKKYELIDDKKHKFIISSHPSGLSCHSPFREYPAFVNCDHFGQVNKYLKEAGKKEILWSLGL